MDLELLAVAGDEFKLELFVVQSESVSEFRISNKLTSNDSYQNF